MKQPNLFELPEAQEPAGDAAPDSPLADGASPFQGDAAEAPAEFGEPESDYVVPVPFFARRRLIAAIAAVALLAIGLVFWLSRGTKAPPHVDVPRATPATIAHEPLPPGPPPIDDSDEPIPETVDEAPPAAGTKGAGAPSAEPSVTPPFGPNVARYPDLPTPVLMQLEKDQEEKAEAKKAK